MPFDAPMVIARHQALQTIPASPAISTHGLEALLPTGPTCPTIEAYTPIQQEPVAAWVTQSLLDHTTRMARITAVCRRVDNLFTPQAALTHARHADGAFNITDHGPAIPDCSAIEMWLAYPTKELPIQRSARVKGMCSAVDDVFKDGMYC